MPSSAICVSSRISTLTPAVAGERRRTRRELARRERVARLVGQLAREVAALAENAAARHGGGRAAQPLVADVDRRRPSTPAAAAGGALRRLVAAAVELRQRQAFGGGLRELERSPVPRTAKAARATRLCRAASPAAVASLRMSAAPRSPLPAADERQTRRARQLPIGDGRQKHFVRFALKLPGRQRPADFAGAWRRRGPWHRRGVVLEPRNEQEVGVDRGQGAGGASDRGRTS